MSCYQASFSKSSNQKICARRNHSACSITLDIDRRQQTSLGDFADCANSRDISRYDRGLLAAKHYQFATHFDEAQREEAPAFYAAPIDDITRQRTFNDKPAGDRVRTQTPAPEDLSHLASPKTYLIALTPRRRDKKNNAASKKRPNPTSSVIGDGVLNRPTFEQIWLCTVFNSINANLNGSNGIG